VDKALEKEVESYISHWKRHGTNPETGEKIKGFKEPKSMTFTIDKEGEIKYL